MLAARGWQTRSVEPCVSSGLPVGLQNIVMGRFLQYDHFVLKKKNHRAVLTTRHNPLAHIHSPLNSLKDGWNFECLKEKFAPPCRNHGEQDDHTHDGLLYQSPQETLWAEEMST